MEFKTFEQLPVNSAEHLFRYTWPRFMLPRSQSLLNWRGMQHRFPQFQLCLVDGDHVCGMINSTPIVWDGDAQKLPDHWDDVVAMALHNDLPTANTLAAVNIAVDPQYRRQGIAKRLLKRLKEIAADNDFKYLVMMVRPSFKEQVPGIPFDSYMNHFRSNGEPIDPWIRTHWRMGAKILRSVLRSSTVQASIEQWHQWSHIDFDHDGEYVIPGALVPVTIDLDADQGTYEDPNLWMVYEIKAAKEKRT